MQRDWLKFPTIQCSHPQKPSMSSALSRWYQLMHRKRKRKMEKMREGSGKSAGMFSGSLTSRRPPSVFRPINLYLTGHLFLSVCWKDCSKPGKGLWDRDAAASCKQIRGWLPLPSESAVSCSRAFVQGHQAPSLNVTAGLTQGEAGAHPWCKAGRAGTQVLGIRETCWSQENRFQRENEVYGTSTWKTHM
jgi:hypothetical protein